MTVEKPIPKHLFRPITTGANSAMNESQFLAITGNLLKARKKSCVHGTIGFGFGFASRWLKNWREFFEPITKHGNRDHVITFESHLKTAVNQVWYWFWFVSGPLVFKVTTLLVLLLLLIGLCKELEYISP